MMPPDPLTTVTPATTSPASQPVPTTIAFSVPAPPVAGSAAVADTGETVLVVDDEPLIRDLLKESLGALGAGLGGDDEAVAAERRDLAVDLLQREADVEHPEHLLAGTRDWLHQDQREPAMPDTLAIPGGTGAGLQVGQQFFVRRLLTAPNREKPLAVSQEEAASAKRVRSGWVVRRSASAWRRSAGSTSCSGRSCRARRACSGRSAPRTGPRGRGRSAYRSPARRPGSTPATPAGSSRWRSGSSPANSVTVTLPRPSASA